VVRTYVAGCRCLEDFQPRAGQLTRRHLEANRVFLHRAGDTRSRSYSPSFRTGGPVGTGLIALIFGGALLWLLGSHHPFTPAGYAGYLARGAVFGKSHFVGIQHGPTSTGRSWLGAPTYGHLSMIIRFRILWGWDIQKE